MPVCVSPRELGKCKVLQQSEREEGKEKEGGRERGIERVLDVKCKEVNSWVVKNGSACEP